MSDNINKKVWLIGAGYMAIEYANVLKKQNVDFDVIGRGESSATKFSEKVGITVKTGGLRYNIAHALQIPDSAIVAVNEDELASATLLLLKNGVKHILVEKPAGLNYKEIYLVAEESIKQQANVYVAYNRRFYASVISARKIIKQDGGVTSFNFEFTEWSHVIEKLDTAQHIKESWFLANSTHVVDLAFYLGGIPKQISSYQTGGLEWHPSGSIFAGAGVTEKGALFSYQANWEAPGRWGVEILTKKHRVILRPLEELHIQKIGSVAIDKVNIDDHIDKSFKPGLYQQTEKFLCKQYDNMLNIVEYRDIFKQIFSIINGKL
jgi:predicted dehydrogenase